MSSKKPVISTGVGRGSKIISKQSPRDNQDHVMKRMLSARKLKINELRNEVDDLNNQLVELQQENKDLKRQHIVREKQLVRYEDQEHDVPYMIQKHNEELRIAKEHVRKLKERATRAEKKGKEGDEEIIKLQRQCKKMNKIIDDRSLGERDELNRKLIKTESDVADKDRRITVSEISITNTHSYV